MVTVRLTSEMLEIIRDMKGKTLKSYEYREYGRDTLHGGTHSYTFDGVRIDLGRFAVHMTCDMHVVDRYGTTEEMTCLTCERVALDTPFDYRQTASPDDIREAAAKMGIYYVGSLTPPPTRTYLVGEKVTGVELVSDRVVFSRDERLEMDMGVVVRTAHGTYTFSRDQSWADTLNVSTVPTGDAPPDPVPVGRIWLQSADQRRSNRVTRTETEL